MIPLFSVVMPPKELLMPALEQTLYSGYIGQGPKVEEFEVKLGEFIGNPNVLSLNSGTSALHLAYRLAGVEGGEVITTPMTCTATNMPIIANGADIVWGDIDPYTGMLDPRDAERKITPRTKAITVVHWGGMPIDLEPFWYLREKYGLPIIEDAAHAFGAKYMGRKIGDQSADYTCFSFQAIKHITTVDGGALLTQDYDTYKRGKLLRWYGIDREGPRTDFRCEADIKEWGYKFHMNDVAATIGLVQLGQLGGVLKKHRDNAFRYDTELIPAFFSTPAWTREVYPSWWLYTLRVRERADFMRYMTDDGIQVSRVHERNDKHTAFAKYACNLPGVDEFASRMVCIPVHSGLNEGQVDAIIRTINEWTGSV